MTSGKATIHSPCLSINIAALLTTQEKGNPRDFVSVSTSSQWIQLPNLFLGTSRSCCLAAGVVSTYIVKQERVGLSSGEYI